MSRTATDAVLALLGTVANIDIYDAHVTDSDNNAKTISAPLPYAVVWTTPGHTINPRVGGGGSRAGEVQVNSVGSTREQAEWAGDETEAVLAGALVTVDGHRWRLRRTQDDVYLRRDDDWTRPDGGPLFVDSRRYSLA